MKRKSGAATLPQNASKSGGHKLAELAKKARKSARRGMDDIAAIMAPGERLTTTQIADALETGIVITPRLLAELVTTGHLRHTRTGCNSVYWRPPTEEKTPLVPHQGRNIWQRGSLQGCDDEWRLRQALCMLARGRY